MQILERKFPKKEWRSISDAEDNESIIYDNDYTCVSIRVGFYLNHLLFIWKAESESESKRKWARGRGKERKRESPFTESNLNTFNGRYCWSGRTGGQELNSDFSCGWQGPKYSCHLIYSLSGNGDQKWSLDLKTCILIWNLGTLRGTVTGVSKAHPTQLTF